MTCRTCRNEERHERRMMDSGDISPFHTRPVARSEPASWSCPDCGAEVEISTFVLRMMEQGMLRRTTPGRSDDDEHFLLPPEPARIEPPPVVSRDEELDDGLLEAIEVWQRRALIAERALLDVLDGTKVHELHGMTGLDDTRCHQIYNVWHKIAYPDKPYPYPETGVGEPEETT
jgi:hypothetical protein